MATYIQNVQDKVTQVRPPETNWQFEAQLLSTRQAKYDAGHDKLSKMYGQILNAGLTREGNIEAREEFFKLIDSDLRKVAGVDLSLDSNVTQAKAVFNQIYDNDFLVKDMVWTKNFRAEMERADGFKNCNDPVECGGEYWDDGVKYMNYKREEFKNSTNDESMRVQNVRYIPFNNLTAQAMKDMKEAELDIIYEPAPDGSRYRVKTRNGSQLVSPLFDLYNGLYAKNPKFQDQFKVLAYNERKDWTYNAVDSGKYSTLEEAAVGFVEERGALIKQNFENLKGDIKFDVDKLEDKLNAYKKDILNGKRLTNSQQIDYTRTEKLLAGSENLTSYLDLIENAQKNQNSQSSMSNIGNILDGTRAANLFNEEILAAARTFSNKNKEITYVEDKGWLAQQQHNFNVDMGNRDFEHQKKLEEHRKLLGHGNYANGDSDYDKMYKSNALAQKYVYDAELAKDEAGLDFFNAVNEFKAEYNVTNVPGGLNKNFNIDEIEVWVEKIKKQDGITDFAAQAEKALSEIKANIHVKSVDANIKSIQAIADGNNPQYAKVDWALMTPEDLIGLRKSEEYLYNKYTPVKSLLEGQVFARMENVNGKEVLTPGVLYQHDQNDQYFVRSGNGKWHMQTKSGTDEFNESNWESGDKVNRAVAKAKGMGHLQETNYY